VTSEVQSDVEERRGGELTEAADERVRVAGQTPQSTCGPRAADHADEPGQAHDRPEHQADSANTQSSVGVISSTYPVVLICRKIWRGSGSVRSNHQTVQITPYINDFQTLNNPGS